MHSPLMKPHLNSIDQDFYLDLHQICTQSLNISSLKHFFQKIPWRLRNQGKCLKTPSQNVEESEK